MLEMKQQEMFSHVCEGRCAAESLLSLGRPVERRQENRDYFGEVNSELKQPAHTMPKVSLTAPGTAGRLDRVWALKCGSAIHRTFIT